MLSISKGRAGVSAGLQSKSGLTAAGEYDVEEEVSVGEQTAVTAASGHAPLDDDLVSSAPPHSSRRRTATYTPIPNRMRTARGGTTHPRSCEESGQTRVSEREGETGRRGCEAHNDDCQHAMVTLEDCALAFRKRVGERG